MPNPRQATLEDLPRLVALGAVMHRESPRFRGLDYWPEKVARMGAQLIQAGGVFLAEQDGEVTGMFVGMVTEHFFGRDKIGIDIAWFVHPGHRGGLLAVRLLKAFEKFALGQGAKSLCLGASTETSTETAEGLYRRMGFRNTGGSWVKEIADVS